LALVGVETPVTWRCCSACPEVAMLNQTVFIVGRIRTKLDAGQLPRSLSPVLWSGFGSGIQCDGCEEPILTSQAEYQVQTDRLPNHRLHKRCAALWQAELLRRGWS
jgi:hypothetical protein